MKWKRLVADLIRATNNRAFRGTMLPADWKTVDDAFADARRALESYVQELENREVRLES